MDKHDCCLEKKRTDGRLPLFICEKSLGRVVGGCGSLAVVLYSVETYAYGNFFGFAKSFLAKHTTEAQIFKNKNNENRTLQFYDAVFGFQLFLEYALRLYLSIIRHHANLSVFSIHSKVKINLSIEIKGSFSLV